MIGIERMRTRILGDPQCICFPVSYIIFKYIPQVFIQAKNLFIVICSFQMSFLIGIVYAIDFNNSNYHVNRLKTTLFRASPRIVHHFGNS